MSTQPDPTATATTTASDPTTAAITTTTTSTAPSTSSPPTKTILVINGPNLNLLGHREPGIYGNTTLTSIQSHLSTLASSRSITILFYQSNHEGAIVDRLHAAFWANLSRKGQVIPSDAVGASSPEASQPVDGIIINPGAYTHTSVAIRDALAGVGIPFVECHISNVHAREAFRHHSYLSEKAEAVIAGLGVFGYVAALEWWCWKWKGGRLEDAGV